MGFLDSFFGKEKSDIPIGKKVYFLPQTHIYQGEYDQQVIDSQRQIFNSLGELKKIGVKDFFVEGITKTYSNSELYDLPESKKIRKIFSNSRYKAEQDKLLALVGGAAIFLTINNFGATIHPTTYDTQIKNIGNSINNFGLQSVKDELSGTYEWSAEQSVKDFLNNNPGKSVALIFGSGHDFSDNFLSLGEEFYTIQTQKELNDLKNQIK